MTHARHIRRRSAALALAAMGAALALLPSTAAAAPGDAWYGWGTKFAVVNGAPKVTFVAYVAQDGAPPKVIASQETDITGTCVERGTSTIDYDTDAANFDGNVYLACELPSWEEATSDLGFNLPDTGECMVCATGGAPIWGDFEVTPAAGVSGTMPIVNASSVGISINVETTGVTARARLDVDRVLGGPTTSYRSPSWTIASAPQAHALVGIEGDGIVAVADYFNWLDYLDLNWRPWFQANVEGPTAGAWVEKTVTAPAARSTQNARQYEMGVDGGPLYIGYDPDTGDIFNGKLGPGGIEPGCKGL